MGSIPKVQFQKPISHKVKGEQIKLQIQVTLLEQWTLNQPLFESLNFGLDANMASPAGTVASQRATAP
jgi:hypothetical protein